MRKKEIITYYTHGLVEAITVNDRVIERIDISSHCDKHFKHGITHELIIKLVRLLDKGEFEADSQDDKKLYFKRHYYELDENYKLVGGGGIDKNYSILYVRTCHPI